MLNSGRAFYDVTEDGERFLMARELPSEARLVMVENFFEELKRLVPN